MGLSGGWHWLILGLVILLMFGTGKISGLMGDFAKGIKAFKKGLAEDDEPKAGEAKPDPKTIEATGGQATSTPDKSKVG